MNECGVVYIQVYHPDKAHHYHLDKGKNHRDIAGRVVLGMGHHATGATSWCDDMKKILEVNMENETRNGIRVEVRVPMENIHRVLLQPSNVTIAEWAYELHPKAMWYVSINFPHPSQ